MSGRLKDAGNMTMGPGPGNYDLMDKTFTGPKFPFGTEDKRGEKSKEGSPGPGAYKVPVKIAYVARYILPGHPEELRYV